MSLRAFTVFQDAPSEASQPKVSRPNAMVTRSQRATSNIATTNDLAVVNKENYNPVTGEKAGPQGAGLKKRKTTVLSTKVQLVPATKAKKEAGLEPEAKKRKSTTGTASKVKGVKKDAVKGATSVKKRTGLKKVAPMPKVAEEESGERVVDADARCYELTVKPLADVSEAYEEVDIFGHFAACATSANTPDGNVKFSTVKELSVEPEIRDYFLPPCDSYPSNNRRLLRALSQDPAPRTFSTPERRQIYSAFTFSSPSATTTRPPKIDGMPSVAEDL